MPLPSTRVIIIGQLCLVLPKMRSQKIVVDRGVQLDQVGLQLDELGATNLRFNINSKIEVIIFRAYARKSRINGVRLLDKDN